MTDRDPPAPVSCCESSSACVFAKALLSRTAVCALAERRAVAERDIVECGSAPARLHCGELAGLLHERARFALRLPAPGRPLIHAQALRLQCGGLLGLQRVLDATQADVHGLVGAAQQRYGSLAELPWAAIVRELAQWPARRPRRGVGA